MKKELFQFQQEALERVKNQKNAALFWGMGTGKTVSSIALTEYWGSEILICLVLKSTLGQWIEELKNQTDRAVFNAYKKSKKDGVQAFMLATGRRALVIGYDAYKTAGSKKLREYISAHAAHVTMICDESSLLGHMESLRTKTVMKTKVEHRLMLSGTPATGGKLESMIATMHMLGWKIEKWEFLSRFCQVYEWTDPARPWMRIPIIMGYKNIEGLRDGLRQHGGSFLTMEEAGVQLPETTEQQVSMTPPLQYRRFMRHGIAELGGLTMSGTNALTRMLYARQLCSCYSAERMAAVEELLEQAGDESVVIFYNWTVELDILQDICKKLKRPVSVVNGQKKDLTAYQEHKPGTIILVQYQAGSMGLNLQDCRIAIFYSLCLSYSDFEQAKARIHRIGQKKNCLFYYLICPETVEQDILETLARRQSYTEKLFTKTYGELTEQKSA